MIKAFLVPTIRASLFLNWLDSLQYVEEDWVVYAQLAMYSKEEKLSVARHKYSDRIKGILWTNSRMPPWIARTNIMKHWASDVDVWCNMDDDVQFIPQTNLEPMVKKLSEPGVGLISANWVRAESMLHKKKIEDKFIVQPAIYTGGGMVFTKQTCKIMLSEPIVPWMADDFHMGLTMYIKGYTNYRYLGSLSIHRIQIKGGLLVIFQTDNMLVHPDPSLVTLRPCSNMYKNAPRNNYFYPMSTDLTDLAHQLHITNKRKLLDG